MERNERSTIFRLIVTGILVVGGSVAASTAATHFSFAINGTITYRDSMLVSLIVPLLVAPPAYCYVAWLSWKLQRANLALDHLARRDVLTSLLNRRAFVEMAEARLADGLSHMLVMADIDHFKRINDSMGHAAGDLALQHTAKLLDSMAPKGSLVARLGGEEFAILLPHGAGDDAAMLVIVEAIRERLEQVPFIAAGGLTRITASFGVARSRPDERLDGILCRADKALYDAKNAGRNRLAMAG
ncbi:GGDEF domain-containing protein [Sphingomonas lacunae]|uniref:diguanylate cyclase n=1 Tax=Sphingomonas lacunae TaxID=2698828 RepID=A0A6M4AWE7_9SPHN|nr:GGDEF domain-containing protein [Sphingomonas lacunae]QJQ32359.1 GGDEF domain-containing protein [Sphingomonas lacunae]